jgi:hypothetical protein
MKERDRGTLLLPTQDIEVTGSSEEGGVEQTGVAECMLHPHGLQSIRHALGMGRDSRHAKAVTDFAGLE